MLQVALQHVKAREKEFSNLDAITGDGDHGEAIVTAMTAIVDTAAAEVGDFKTLLSNIGFDVMLQVSGSTSTLLGALFLGMSDAASGDALSAEDVKAVFAAGLRNVQKQTPACQGDKTMMDALIPAVEAINAAQADDIVEIMRLGAEAAQAGAASTVNMKANFGRARNYGERSIGYADCGAASWSCMFNAFYEAIKTKV